MFVFVFDMLILIIIFYSVCYIMKLNKGPGMKNCYNLLQNVLITQRFSSSSTLYTDSNFYIIRADNNGENYIFGVKKDYSVFTYSEIEKIYEIAEKAHIHTRVLASYISLTENSALYRKIKEYGFDVWDYNKLAALADEHADSSSTHSYSVLQTSDVSDDHCKIDENSYDPIQENTSKVKSLFSGLFDKPDHL